MTFFCVSVLLALAGILFSLTMLMVSVALVMAVIVTNIFLRKDSGKRVPSSVRRVFIHRRHRPRLASLPPRTGRGQTDRHRPRLASLPPRTRRGQTDRPALALSSPRFAWLLPRTGRGQTDRPALALPGYFHAPDVD